MAPRCTITVSITPELKAFIEGRLRSGRYGNASEVVRTALRLLEDHEPDLRKIETRPPAAQHGAS